MLIYFIGLKLRLVDNNMSKGKFYFIVFLVSLLLSSCSNTDLYTNRFCKNILIIKVIFNMNLVLSLIEKEMTRAGILHLIIGC